MMSAARQGMSGVTGTVAAVSTPPGKGGIAVIRVSGSDAFDIADRVFRPKNGRKLSELPFRMMVYGGIISDGRETDDGMAVLFKGPNSYTGEDTAEISCHGGPLLTETVLGAVFAAGARPAAAGEFTKRAFLNGRLGLTKAESVIDLIDAESPSQIALASAQSRGILSRRIGDIYDMMKRLISSIYVFIDFPDEDLSDVPPAEVESGIVKIEKELESLLETYRTGRSVKEGVAACICGKPNVGKSSLLNALLGRERAIVTPIAGTTRDVISEKTRIGRCAVRISDTAGIRSTEDAVELIGTERAEAEMRDSELIIAVFDGSSPLDAEDTAFIERINASASGKAVIAAVNKSDLDARLDCSELKKLLPQADIVKISAKDGEVSPLTGLIDGKFTDLSLDLTADAVVSSARQYAAISRARDDIADALVSLRGGFTQDVAALDIEHAMSDLGEVDGISVSEDVVSDIFSRFCVGK